MESEGSDHPHAKESPLPQPHVMTFKGSIQFDHFVHHKSCALLFEYVYELSRVHTQSDLSTRSVKPT